jgi:L-ascorbate metabolism protein UlaG (beta-lactamase superfamily)
MRLTFHGHACVRLDGAGTRLAVDPGTFADAQAALDGATAVLLTHEHPDHVAAAAVAAALRADAHLEAWGATGAMDALTAAGAPADRVHAVGPGDVLTLGQARVTVGGGEHALIHPAIPRAANVTFLVELDGATAYHPGDSFDLPAADVDVLLTPVSGPWLRLGEVIDFARAASARHLVPVHDALLTEVGHRMVAGRLSDRALVGEHVYSRLAPGESLTV